MVELRFFCIELLVISNKDPGVALLSNDLGNALDELLGKHSHYISVDWSPVCVCGHVRGL